MNVSELSRRRLLQVAAGLGIASTLPGTAGAERSSPDLERFVQPLPIPEVRAPDGERAGADFYDIPIRAFEEQAHPDLPPTTFWGFDGEVPGPIIKAERGERIKLRFDNSALPDEHLFEIDDLVHGTDPEDYDDYDGRVPDVRTSIHQHGLNVEWQSDGQAAAWKSPDGVTGPRFEKHVHDLPNRQDRMTATYHDHALGISRLNNYAGLNGFYVIESEQERQLDLPSGDYDVPLMLQDRIFEDDGSLHYPSEFVPNVSGDTALVNGAVWPYFEVEPRRYRFRLVNQSNGRTFDLSLENDGHGHEVPTMYQFAPDQGFLDEVVPIGHGGDVESLVLAPFERAEVVVDFSEYAGETLTLTNDAEFPFAGGEDGGHGGHGDGHDDMSGSDEETDDHEDDHDGHEEDDEHEEAEPYQFDLPEIMQFRVADEASGPDDSVHPTELDLPDRSGFNENAARETREMTLGMEMKMGEPDLHVLNGKTFHDDRDDIARPQLGTTEVWELTNEGHHSHPIHLHLVTFEVVGRGPDGTHDPAPTERGPKDVVRVDPGETVRIVTRFENFTGTFPWHCHVLEHEEHAMMRPFEVVPGDDDGDRGNSRWNRDARIR